MGFAKAQSLALYTSSLSQLALGMSWAHG